MNTEHYRKNLIIKILLKNNIPIEIIKLFILPRIDNLYPICNECPVNIKDCVIKQINIGPIDIINCPDKINIKLPTGMFIYPKLIKYKELEKELKKELKKEEKTNNNHIIINHGIFPNYINKNIIDGSIKILMNNDFSIKFNIEKTTSLSFLVGNMCENNICDGLLFNNNYDICISERPKQINKLFVEISLIGFVII